MAAEDKLIALQRALRDMGRVLVALSGGVDTTFLLRMAVEELGPNAIALTTRSPTAAEDDEAMAVTLAEALGVRHLLIDANELEIPGYAENPTNRCYFCKGSLYDICDAEAAKFGLNPVLAPGGRFSASMLLALQTPSAARWRRAMPAPATARACRR